MALDGGRIDRERRPENSIFPFFFCRRPICKQALPSSFLLFILSHFDPPRPFSLSLCLSLSLSPLGAKEKEKSSPYLSFRTCAGEDKKNEKEKNYSKFFFRRRIFLYKKVHLTLTYTCQNVARFSLGLGRAGRRGLSRWYK